MPSDFLYNTFRNVDSVPLSRGMVVRQSAAANNSIVRAQADSTPHLQGLVGVVESGIIGINGQANVATASASQIVLLETGLTPARGDTLYVSASVAGRGTNVAPSTAVSLGVIVDTSTYSQNNTVTAVLPLVGATAGSSTPSSFVADWSITGARVFALDGTNGSDTNLGYADSADTTQANVAIATIAAGLVAKRTLAGLMAVLPPVGARRTALVVIRAGTYVENLGLLDSAKGYLLLAVRGTETSTTAGATAFSGTTADLIFCGAATGTGMNASGYNPTSSTTSDTITLAQVGGGSPSFAAEPAKPLFLRWRWDANTPTVALRNTVSSIVEIPSATSVRLAAAVAFTTGDTGYIEQPGAIFAPSPAATAAFTGGNTNTAFNGVGTGSAWSPVEGRYTYAFCSIGASHNPTANDLNSFVTTCTGFSPNPTIGPSRCETATNATGGTFSAATASYLTGTTLAFAGLTASTFGNQNVVGTNVLITGGAGTTDASSAQGFGTTSTTASLLARVLGHMDVRGARFILGSCNFPKTTEAYAVKIFGTNDIMQTGRITGGLKTDCGVDFSFSAGSRVVGFTAAGMVTGANGDLKYGQNNAYGTIYCTYDGMGNNKGALFLSNGDVWMQQAFDPVGGGGNQYINAAATAIAVAAVNTGGVDVPASGLVQFWDTPGDSADIRITDADALATAKGAIGVAICPIANNKVGWVIVAGTAHINYTGAPLGVGPGQPVYLSSTPGEAVIVPPAAPAVVRMIGWTVAETYLKLAEDPRVLGRTFLDAGTGIYDVNVTVVASGGNAVTWNNSPVAVAAPVRYMKMPDGLGGFFTVPSVT